MTHTFKDLVNTLYSTYVTELSRDYTGTWEYDKDHFNIVFTPHHSSSSFSLGPINKQTLTKLKNITEDIFVTEDLFKAENLQQLIIEIFSYKNDDEIVVGLTYEELTDVEKVLKLFENKKQWEDSGVRFVFPEGYNVKRISVLKYIKDAMDAYDITWDDVINEDGFSEFSKATLINAVRPQSVIDILNIDQDSETIKNIPLDNLFSYLFTTELQEKIIYTYYISDPLIEEVNIDVSTDDKISFGDNFHSLTDDDELYFPDNYWISVDGRLYGAKNFELATDTFWYEGGYDMLCDDLNFIIKDWPIQAWHYKGKDWYVRPSIQVIEDYQFFNIYTWGISTDQADNERLFVEFEEDPIYIAVTYKAIPTILKEVVELFESTHAYLLNLENEEEDEEFEEE